MIDRISLAAGALVAAALAGCASDPNKDVKEARTDEIEARRDAREDAAGAERRQAEAKAERDQGAAAADADRRYGDSAKGDRVEAESKMTEARKKYRAKAVERVQKLDARAAELRAKLEQAGTKATTEARDRVAAIRNQRELVGRETDQLGRINDDAWEGAVKSLNTRIDELEEVTKRAASEVDRK
jgi:hypothetical protein